MTCGIFWRGALRQDTIVELSASLAIPQNIAPAKDAKKQGQEGIVDSEVKRMKTLEPVCMQNQCFSTTFLSLLRSFPTYPPQDSSHTASSTVTVL